MDCEEVAFKHSLTAPQAERRSLQGVRSERMTSNKRRHVASTRSLGRAASRSVSGLSPCRSVYSKLCTYRSLVKFPLRRVHFNSRPTSSFTQVARACKFRPHDFRDFRFCTLSNSILPTFHLASSIHSHPTRVEKASSIRADMPTSKGRLRIFKAAATMAASAINDTDSTKPGLLTLPAELRNRIPELVLVEQQPIKPFDGSGGQEVAVPPALTAVSRQLRAESVPVYYGRNDFHISTGANFGPGPDCDRGVLRLKAWLSSHDHHLPRMPHLEIQLCEMHTTALVFTHPPGGKVEYSFRSQDEMAERWYCAIRAVMKEMGGEEIVAQILGEAKKGRAGAEEYNAIVTRVTGLGRMWLRGFR